MFQPIGKVIEKRVKEYGFENKLLAVEISEAFSKALDDILGTNNPGSARVVSFKNGTLIIRIPNLAVRQKISLEKEKIINFLNKKLRGRIVKKVVLRA